VCKESYVRVYRGLEKQIVNDLNVCNHLSSKAGGNFKIYKGYAERFGAKSPGLMGFGQNAMDEAA
jgi:hypothetical protein